MMTMIGLIIIVTFRLEFVVRCAAWLADSMNLFDPVIVGGVSERVLALATSSAVAHGSTRYSEL